MKRNVWHYTHSDTQKPIRDKKINSKLRMKNVSSIFQTLFCHCNVSAQNTLSGSVWNQRHHVLWVSHDNKTSTEKHLNQPIHLVEVKVFQMYLVLPFTECLIMCLAQAGKSCIKNYTRSKMHPCLADVERTHTRDNVVHVSCYVWLLSGVLWPFACVQSWVIEVNIFRILVLTY